LEFYTIKCISRPIKSDPSYCKVSPVKLPVILMKILGAGLRYICMILFLIWGLDARALPVLHVTTEDLFERGPLICSSYTSPLNVSVNICQ